MASNFIPGAFPTTASSSTTAVSLTNASSATDATAYPGSGVPQPRQDTQAYLTQQMLFRRDEFLRQQRIKIKIGTWNVAAVQGVEKDLGDWIVDKQKDLHTVSVAGGMQAGTTDEKDEKVSNHDEVGIYVIALQEVVDVTATSTFIQYTDPKIALNWKAHAQVRPSL